MAQPKIKLYFFLRFIIVIFSFSQYIFGQIYLQVMNFQGLPTYAKGVFPNVPSNTNLNEEFKTSTYIGKHCSTDISIPHQNQNINSTMSYKAKIVPQATAVTRDIKHLDVQHNLAGNYQSYQPSSGPHQEQLNNSLNQKSGVQETVSKYL